MNKTAIKNFAIWARNKLIADIQYRAGLIGITADGIHDPLPQSDGNTEFYDIGTAEPYALSREDIPRRKKLAEKLREKEADTDYATAYKYILEEVAYTWFNRLIAIRFMEVNDYLPGHIRVLSSESGKLEPDLVTTPFDGDLNFSEAERTAVIRMKQENQTDELFRLLLRKQCQSLSEYLPVLFVQDTPDNYFDLLLSLSVIDQEGVVYHLTHDIPEADFNVSEGGQVEIIGWLYQYYNTEPKDETFALLKRNVKVSRERIPSATQLFTPDWIVRYMVENSLGRLWLEGHPNENLQSGWKYYLPEAEQEPEVQEQLEELRRHYAKLRPEEITVMDPCCGSGHILVYAFDVLMEIYTAMGWSERDAAQNIVRQNLWGLDIDKRAVQLSYFAVMMKARQYDRRFLTRNIQPQIYAPTGYPEGEEYGSLIRVEDLEPAPDFDSWTIYDGDYETALNRWNFRHALSRQYDVVVTNPPYMGSGNMDAALSKFVKDNYPDSKADMFACFIERGFTLTKPDGYESMITMESWMFLSSFEKLRSKLMQSKTIKTLVHMPYLGKGGTSLGINFGTDMAVIQNRHIKGYVGTYDRIAYYETDDDGIPFEFPTKNDYYKQTTQDNFAKIPGAPVAYWVSKAFFNAYKHPSLSSYGRPCKGIDTGDNNIFLRMWFEPEAGKISFPKTEPLQNDDGRARIMV